MRLFTENPEKYIEEYSRDFEETFLELLRRKYYGHQVLANKIYQEHISDKMHTHMNATKWTNLTGFVDHLVQTDKVESEWTEKGLFIKIKDSNTDTKMKKIEEDRKLQAKLKKEEQEKHAMDQQLELAMRVQEERRLRGETDEEEPPAPVDLGKDHQQVSFSLSGPKKNVANPLAKAANTTKNQLQPNMTISINAGKTLGSFGSLGDATDAQEAAKHDKRKPVSELERVLEKAKAEKKMKLDTTASKNGKGDVKSAVEEEEDFSWVTENIIVKIKDEALKKYFNQKGKIVRVVEPFLAEVEVLNTTTKLQIDQDLLETVIPAIGHKVKVLKNGPYYGKIAVLESIHADSFSASVHLQDIDVALELPYEKICKVVL